MGGAYLEAQGVDMATSTLGQQKAALEATKEQYLAIAFLLSARNAGILSGRIQNVSMLCICSAKNWNTQGGVLLLSAALQYFVIRVAFLCAITNWDSTGGSMLVATGALLPLPLV